MKNLLFAFSSFNIPSRLSSSHLLRSYLSYDHSTISQLRYNPRTQSDELKTAECWSQGLDENFKYANQKSLFPRLFVPLAEGGGGKVVRAGDRTGGIGTRRSVG